MERTSEMPGDPDEAGMERHAAALGKDPVLLRYSRKMQKLQRVGKQRMRAEMTPGDVLGELLSFRFMVLKGDVTFFWTDLSKTGPVGARRIVSDLLSVVAPYTWTQEVCDTLDASPPLGKLVVDAGSFRQHPVMYWSNPKTWAFSMEGRSIGWYTTIIARNDDWLRFVFLGADMDQVENEAWVSIQDHQTGETFETAPNDVLEDLFKREAFLRSPYTVVTKQRLPAPVERKLRRKGAGSLPDVSVIDLRRPTIEGTGEPTGRRYDRHRWWVTGHVRHQWYPSEKTHRLIYVQPHLKGPPDAPLKRSVYRVRR